MSDRRQKTTETNEQYLKAAIRYCRIQYNEIRDDDRNNSHSSHYASEAMKRTEKRFIDLGTFGVEGFCDSHGRNGISYLNTGDCYGRTILFKSKTERFSLGCWGDIVENDKSYQ